MTFQAYAKRVDSGVEWLGSIPSHWRVLRFHRCIRVVEGQVDPEDARYSELTLIAPNHIESGTGRLLGTESAAEQGAESGKYPCQAGDVIYSKIRPALRKACIAREDCLCSADMYPLQPMPGLTNGFLLYTLLSEPFTAFAVLESQRVAMPKVNRESLREFLIPVPSLDEQEAIVAFLNSETEKIDALIAEQERLIELLEEKRQAVITHAVTKGLNPKTPMKHSGVPWLGSIPAHWGVVQSRRLFAVRNDPALPNDVMLTASQKHGVLPQAEFVEREGRRVVEVIKGVEQLRHVEPNDFIISMRSFQGGLEWSKLRGSTSFHYVMVVPRDLERSHPPFFAHLFKSSTYIQALRSTTDLIRDGQEIRYSHFVQVPLPVVPLDEQKAIAELLDRELAGLDALATEAERAVALLTERRAALITAAVTGQIDVRPDSMRTAA